MMSVRVITITEPEIIVGHWPFSNQFQDLANVLLRQIYCTVSVGKSSIFFFL